jgi:hypothetical protein
MNPLELRDKNWVHIRVFLSRLLQALETRYRSRRDGSRIVVRSGRSREASGGFRQKAATNLEGLGKD